jgi:peroxiredoxin
MRIASELLIGICVAACLFGSACTKQSSEARETAGEETNKNTQVAQNDPGHESPEAGEQLDSGGSEDAYALVIQEIKRTQKEIRDQNKMIARVLELFHGFIADYPGTDEAADAQLNLGQIYAQLGRNEESIAVLYELIDGGTASNEKIGIAHYLLGDAYKAADKFDESKREYQLVVDRYSFLGPQIVGMARSNIEDLDTLKQLAIGSKPIPFEVKSTDGEVVSIDKYKGKVVLLDFWATWCGPCRADMPYVVDLYEKHHKKGFEIIGISLDRSRAAMDQYVEANNMDWPQFFDGKYWQNEVAMKYKVRQIPTTFLIDRQGVIRYRSLRGKQLERAVNELIKETS